MRADEYPTTQGLVAAGLGVALVPARSLGLVHERHVYAAVRRVRAGEPVVAAALEALVAAARATRRPAA